MPKIASKTTLIGAVDTEVNGVDLRHGAEVYYVSTCDSNGNLEYWEWDVDLFTRKVHYKPEQVREVRKRLESFDKIILQNCKFDIKALSNIPNLNFDWPWDKTEDTLYASHLLASNQPKDLTVAALVYCKVNIAHFEEAIKQATNSARSLAESNVPGVRLYKEGLPEAPSAGENNWKGDMYLPKAMIKYALKTLNFALIPSEPHLPTVVTKDEPHDIYIGRGSKWGNPFEINSSRNRTEAILEYVDYIWNNEELIQDLPELYGKRLGCYCKPKICHGDVLRLLCHSWMTVLKNYANADSEVTLPIWKAQQALIRKRKLDKIWRERCKLPEVIYGMEEVGISVNGERLKVMVEKYQEEKQLADSNCRTIANHFKYDLDLPKSGNNKSLIHFVFGYYEGTCKSCGHVEEAVKFKSNLCKKCYKKGLEIPYNLKHIPCLSLPPVKLSKKTGEPSLDKVVIEEYEARLPEKSLAKQFLRNLSASRKRGTALAFMESYEKFWLPIPGNPRWFKLYPSLNAVATSTLRFSSSNPNEQNISKKEGFNLRYAFGPSPGREWWSLDAKNIELRLPAYEAGETEMINLFERPNDPPYYGSNHLLVFDTLHPEKFAQYGKKVKDIFESTWYQWTKNGNFAVQYGSVEQSGTADAAYHVPGAFKKVKSRFQAIHGPGGLNEACIHFANKNGYVETIPDKNVDPERGYPLICSRTNYGKVLETVPLNYHTQGSAMWWMCKAMVRCWEYLKKLNTEVAGGYFMIIQVHDELVFDFPSSKGKFYSEGKPAPWLYNLRYIRDIQRLMELGGDDFGIPTPVSVEYHSETWAEGISL